MASWLSAAGWRTELLLVLAFLAVGAGATLLPAAADAGKLKPGEVVTVAREGGTRPGFKMDSVRTYPKTRLPTQFVHAGEQATLRVITCGGEFDTKNENYLSNAVVFASLDT